MQLSIRRVYAPASPDDGRRILVDALWPRGVAKATLADATWLKAIAPGKPLRDWFGHRPERWPEFRRRYFAELDANADAVAALRALIGTAPATLLYAARDEAHNNAIALKDYLQQPRH